MSESAHILRIGNELVATLLIRESRGRIDLHWPEAMRCDQWFNEKDQFFTSIAELYKDDPRPVFYLSHNGDEVEF